MYATKHYKMKMFYWKYFIVKQTENKIFLQVENSHIGGGGR